MTRPREGSFNALQLLRQRAVVGSSAPRSCQGTASPDHALEQWLEEELLRHCASAYCNNVPPLPRSTIALAFSPDGKLLASTHGDHTVKVTCCKTGACLKVLREHERTPWAVKFHPTDSNLLASGSLDSTVRIWDLAQGACVCSYNFGRPISSIAFSPGGDALAVASGHRLYMWRYGLKMSKSSSSEEEELVLLLKTKRSLRAVHFHPQGAPLMLTAEVTSGAQNAKHARATYPLDYTGVLDGVEVDERRRRYNQRGRLLDGERQLPQNPQAFGEQLSMALQALQTSSGPEGAATVATPAVQSMDLGSSSDRGQVWQQSAADTRMTSGQAREVESPAAISYQQSHCSNLRHQGCGSSQRSLSTSACAPQRDASQCCHSSSAEPCCQPGAPVTSETEKKQQQHSHSTGCIKDGSTGDSTSERGTDAFEDEAARSGSSTEFKPEQRAQAAVHKAQPEAQDLITGTELKAEQGMQAGSSKEQPKCKTPGKGLRPDAKPFHPQGYRALLRQFARPKVETVAMTGQSPQRGQTEGQVATDKAAGKPSSAIADWIRLTRLMECRDSSQAQPPKHGPQGVLQRISSSGGPSAAVEGSTEGGLQEGREPSHIHGSSPVRNPERATIQLPITRQAMQLPHLVRSISWDMRYPDSQYRQQLREQSLADARTAATLPHPSPHRSDSTRRAGADVDGHSREPAADFPQGSTREAAIGSGERPSGKEVGCHVLVRLWRLDQSGKPALKKLQLAIQNTVLCSDMGLSISPCGKLLALCACPEAMESREHGIEEEKQYELQVFSLETPTFGEVLASRPIKAAHCLTAIQISPGSRHILLAYGRRDASLQQHLQTVENNARSIVSLNTVLEVYRIQDMSIVRVLPSADDEINTALFHPFMGCGLAYGTKEGRLRVLTHSSRPLLASKKLEGQGRFEDELLAAAHEAYSHTSEEEG